MPPYEYFFIDFGCLVPFFGADYDVQLTLDQVLMMLGSIISFCLFQPNILHDCVVRIACRIIYFLITNREG